MSSTSYNFKNHITVDNNKNIKWLDSEGAGTPVIKLDTNDDVILNPHPSGKLILNSGGNQNTIINPDNTNHVYVDSKLGIGLSAATAESIDLNANLTVVTDGYIGTNNSSGTLGISGSDELSNSKSSRILLHANGNSLGTSKGNLNLYAGDTETSSINFYTTDNTFELPKMKVNKNSVQMLPNGADLKFEILNDTTEIRNELKLTSSANATGRTVGGTLTVSGGAAIAKSLFLGDSIPADGLNSGGTLTVYGGASISGDLYVGGAITNYSDIRLKSNVQPLKTHANDNMCDFIEKVRTIRFNYIEDMTEQEHIGFIAQDFIERFPELLRKPDTEFYSLDYSKLTVLLVECVKELKKEIRELKQQINSSSH